MARMHFNRRGEPPFAKKALQDVSQREESRLSLRANRLLAHVMFPPGLIHSGLVQSFTSRAGYGPAPLEALLVE